MAMKKAGSALKARGKQARKRAPLKKRPTFAKKVMAVVSKMAENKIAVFRLSNNGLAHYNNSTWDLRVVPCTPFTSFLTVQQGVAQSSRIGNQIRVKKLKMSGVIRPAIQNATLNATPTPCIIRLFWVTRKDNPNAVVTDLSDFLQYGSTSEAPSGNLVDLTRPVNRDEWTVHATRTFKLGYADNAGTGATPGAQNFANNDFKSLIMFSVDLTKASNKIMRFDDTSVIPTGKVIYCIPLVYRCNNNVYDSDDVPAYMDYTLEMEYEDM